MLLKDFDGYYQIKYLCKTNGVSQRGFGLCWNRRFFVYHGNGMSWNAIIKKNAMRSVLLNIYLVDETLYRIIAPKENDKILILPKQFELNFNISQQSKVNNFSLETMMTLNDLQCSIQLKKLKTIAVPDIKLHQQAI